MSNNHSTEQWKRVPGWPAYEVSNRGRVRSFWRREGTREHLRMVIGETPRLLKAARQPTGHRHVTLGDGTGQKQVTYSIAHLVLMTFVRPPAPGEMALHTNVPDTENNWLENLRWGTRADNHKDIVRHTGKHAAAKLSANMVREIRKMIADGVEQKQIAAMHGVSQGTITYIKQGKVGKSVPT